MGDEGKGDQQRNKKGGWGRAWPLDGGHVGDGDEEVEGGSVAGSWRYPIRDPIPSKADWLVSPITLSSDFTHLSYMVAMNGDWLWASFEHLLLLLVLLCIAAIKPPIGFAQTDSLGWLPSLDRSFSVPTAYRMGMGLGNANNHRNTLIFEQGDASGEPIMVVARRLVQACRDARSLRGGRPVLTWSQQCPHVVVQWKCSDAEVNFSHVPRAADSVADCLAKNGFEVDHRGQFYFQPSGFVLSVYHEDC
ncbi:hypothetical protein V6N12_019415 [Hibiscus sabdariffa]|uniref:Uncharacterized protein n=1 Tax=Hibiscus sabdariffa TaxID=183260 RepID=A0ABR2BM59_9ROSI